MPGNGNFSVRIRTGTARKNDKQLILKALDRTVKVWDGHK